MLMINFYKEKVDQLKRDSNNYVSLGELSRSIFNRQAQYGCPPFSPEHPKQLGKGLRILGDSKDYHSMKIHFDDLNEAITRYYNRNEISE
jgi:hypothetical protein